MQGQIWAEKYAPKKLSDLSGNSETCAKAKRWALELERGTRRKALCLWGGTGIGKTALAHAVASELGWEVIVFSAYDVQDFDRWRKSLASALSGSSLFGTRQLVLLEAVDTWAKSGARGILSEVAASLASASTPAILTATDWYDRSLVPLRTYVEQVQMKAVNSSDIESALKRIIAGEKLSLPEGALDAIVSKSSGDLRAAVNDLQASNFDSSRNHPQQLLAKVRAAIRSVSYKASKLSQIGAAAERDMLKMYVMENLPAEFPGATSRAKAFSRLSRADVFDGRILRTQYWGYLRYSSDLMMWGVSSERVPGGPAFVAYGFPSYIQKMGASRGRRAVFKSASKKISLRTHTTTRTARDFFPLILAQRDSKALCAFYGFDEEEVAALTGTVLKPSEKAAKPEPSSPRPSSSKASHPKKSSSK